MNQLFAKHGLTRASLPLFSAYYYRQWNNYEMDFHIHDSIEIMYVINGSCQIELCLSRADSPALFSLKKGEFIVLDGNVPHRLIVKAESGCRMLNVEFTFKQGLPLLPSIYELANKNDELAYFIKQVSDYVVLRDVDEVYATLKSLVLELEWQRESSNKSGKQANQEQGSLKQELLFTGLILHIANLYKFANQLENRLTAAQQYVKQVQHYIQQNYDGELSVEQLARHVNVHPNYLHRIFRAETGMTIIQYLNQFRLDKAMMLLSQTDIAIADICEFVGINSRQYFHELFKKYTGLTPVQYREQSNRQLPDPNAKSI